MGYCKKPKEKERDAFFIREALKNIFEVYNQIYTNQIKNNLESENELSYIVETGNCRK